MHAQAAETKPFLLFLLFGPGNEARHPPNGTPLMNTLSPGLWICVDVPILPPLSLVSHSLPCLSPLLSFSYHASLLLTFLTFCSPQITIGTLKHGMGKKMGRMKGMFKKAGRKRLESMDSGPGEVTRSPSEDTMPDGSVADESDTSSTYDEVCTLVLVTPYLVSFQDPQ